MRKIYCVLCLMLFLTATPALALYTELGVSYARKTTTFDQNNTFDSESVTGSVSLYFLERLALELSYTDATGLRKEKAFSTDPQRTTTQKSQIMGADLIFVFADKKALFQPYIKGGGAQIIRKQIVDIEGFSTYTLPVDNATVPSYGVGLKIALTDGLGIKLSYDVWKTPTGGGEATDDTSIRAGITWVL